MECEDWGTTVDVERSTCPFAEESLEISDIVFANYSQVYAQVLSGRETNLYRVFTGKYSYNITISSHKFFISRCLIELNPWTDNLFFKKLDIKTFSDLEVFILAQQVLGGQ